MKSLATYLKHALRVTNRTKRLLPYILSVFLLLFSAAVYAATADVRPNATAAEAGGSCDTTNAHTTLDDDVESPSADLCSADTATAAHDIRLNFATPSLTPGNITNVQTFKVLARNSQTSGSGVATVALDFYCNGVLVEAGADQNLSDSLATISETFTFSTVSCVADGSDAEVLVDCTAANNGGTNNDTSCTYDAVEWVVDDSSNTPPTVTTSAASSILATSSVLNASIDSTGGANATVRGFASSTNATLSSGVATSTETGSFGAVSFTGSMAGLTGNNTYYFRAYATNPLGTSTGAILNFLTLPNIPSTVSWSSVAATSSTLTWSAPTGGTASYKLVYCDTSGTCTQSNGLTVTSTTTNPSLVGNTTYTARIRGTNATGDGLFSASTTQLTLPNIPGTPTFSNVTGVGMRVSWAAPTGGAASYKVERCTGSGCSDFAQIASGETNTFYDDSGLSNSTTYRYRVRGTNATGDGLYSTAAEQATSAGAPTVDTNAASSVVATSSVLNGDITSTGGENASRRGFATSTSATLSSGVSTSTESGSFGTGAFTGVSSNLTGNTTYYFRAYATNGGGTSTGAILNFLTLPDVPGTPSYSNTAATSTGITWTAPTGGTATYTLNQCQGGSCTLFTGLGSNSTTTYSLVGNTTYEYAVRGVNATGNGLWSASSTQLTVPNIPGTPTFSSITSSAMRVSWTAPTGGSTSYKVERCSGTGCTNFSQIASGVTDLFYDDSGLTQATTYRYRVRGTNATGDGAYSSGAEQATLASIPSVTTNSASSVAATSLTLNGDITNTGGETGGGTQHGFAFGTNTLLANGDTSTSTLGTYSGTGAYTDSESSLTGNTPYYFRAYASNSAGAGFGSIQNQLTLPGTPDAPSISNVIATSTTVTWSAPTGGTASYKLQYCINNTTTCTLSSGLTVTSTTTNPSLTGNTTYSFAVRGTNATGDGIFSASTTQLTLPDVPSTVSWSSVAATSSTLTWSAPTGGTASYKLVYCDTSGTCTQSNGLTVTSTTTNPSLVGNTTYSARILGTNATGDGLFSASTTQLTVPNIPGTPTFSSVTATAMRVSWTAPTGGSTSYKVERCSGTGCTNFSQIAAAVTDLFYDDSSLSPATTYRYRVRGTNATGDGAYSAGAEQATLASIPSVTTNSASSVAATSLTLNGDITNTGGETGGGTQHGFAFGTNTLLANGDTSTSTLGTYSGTGAYTDSESSLTGNTPYYFRAYASNSAGAGFGSIQNQLTLPGTPDAPSISNVIATSTTVTWSAPTGGTASYKLQYCINNTTTCTLSSGLTVTSTTTNPSLTGNTTYSFAVRGSNATGDGIFSASTTQLTVPNIPGTPTFSNVTGESVRVSWSAPTGGSTSYKVERCSGAGCTNFAEIAAGVTDLFYDDSGLVAETAYRFRVRGTNATGDGLYSGSDGVTTGAPSLPTVSTGTTTDLTAVSALLQATIDATGGASGASTEHGFAWGTQYNLSGGNTATTTLGTYTGPNPFSELLENLTREVKYYYRAYASNSTGAGMGSILSFFTTAQTGGVTIGTTRSGAGTVSGGGSGGGANLNSDPNFLHPTGNSSASGYGTEWTSPSEAYSSNDSYASAVASAGNLFQDFNFSIPEGNQIIGIAVKLEAKASSAAGSIEVELSWDGGTSMTSSSNSSGTLSTGDTVYTLGGASESWGRSWAQSEFSNGNFRVRVVASPSGNTVQLDHVQVRVYHQAGGGGSGGGGDI